MSSQSRAHDDAKAKPPPRRSAGGKMPRNDRSAKTRRRGADAKRTAAARTRGPRGPSRSSDERTEHPTSHTLEFRPFPTEVLPKAVGDFVRTAAGAVGCDESFVALPVLAVLAAAVGNSRRLQLKPGWTEPPILWTAIIAPSGSQKTPAFKLALRPLGEVQLKALRDHELARREDRETAPPATRCLVSDVTVAALAPILASNWRGVLLARDELSGWLASLDRSAVSRRGGEATHWLSMHSGELMIVDRKAGAVRSVIVPSAAVSVTGGIQPGILARVIGREHRENGLLARLLLAMPPQRPKSWRDQIVAPEHEAVFALLIERLRELDPIETVEGPQPLVLRMTPRAKRCWVSFYNRHAKQHAQLAGDLAAAWSKLEAGAARLALVVHLSRQAADDEDPASPDAVDERSVEAAVKLVGWFGREARRVYALLGASEEGRGPDLVDVLRRRGGTITARALARGSRTARKKGTATTRRSLLDAATEVLRTARKPMSAREIVEAVLEAGTWRTAGATPTATLSAAIHRELRGRGREARFRRTGRGRFALATAG